MDHGTVKTSAIFIASGDTTSVYRSLEEMPEDLRKKLAAITSSSNCATVLIADRRGIEELERSRLGMAGRSTGAARLLRRLAAALRRLFGR